MIRHESCMPLYVCFWFYLYPVASISVISVVLSGYRMMCLPVRTQWVTPLIAGVA